MRSVVVIVSGVLLFAVGFAFAGEGGFVPEPELQALERAIARERSTGDLGALTLSDLQRLLQRLRSRRSTGAQADRTAALEPLDYAVGDKIGDDAGTASLRKRLFDRLEAEARGGTRPALRSLALYRVFLGEPEAALETWRKMGSANAGDVSFHLISAYLELALGNYNSARSSLERATGLVDSRSGLELSKPVFCQNIAGYRLYEARKEGDLLPGDETLIYLEIDGADFHTLPSGDSECNLVFGMRLANEAGHTRWNESNYGEYAPIFNGPIRDLHTALSWRVPNDLQPGYYTLHIEAVENASHRRGETAIEFNVARRPTNPEPRLGETKGVYPPGFNEAMREANKSFPGSMPMFNTKAEENYYQSEEFKRTQSYQDMIKSREQNR